MNELFKTPETLSPRLAWMREKDVKTREAEGDWAAYIGDPPHDRYSLAMMKHRKEIALGDSEEEAIFALAKAQGWTLWNEGVRK